MKCPEVSNTLEFNDSLPKTLKPQIFEGFINEGVTEDWPVVYVIRKDGSNLKDSELYVGETTNVLSRMSQHLQNNDRRRLTHVNIISSPDFNKSSILDLESYLINHFQADNSYILQNGNAGQVNHNYYQKEAYEKEFSKVWKLLAEKLRIAHKDIAELENSGMFKYSPYKALTVEQYGVVTDIIHSLSKSISTARKDTFLVKGSAGTGKTILAIYLTKLLSAPISDDNEIQNEQLTEDLCKIHSVKSNLKIGIVVSMTNLRFSLKKIFAMVHGLSPEMVLSPSQAANYDGSFDILIVDEAHRLKTEKNAGTEIGNIRKNNVMLGLEEKSGNQLDWILKKSKFHILFYDNEQSIKITDIPSDYFNELEKKDSCQIFELTTQLRCMKGGSEYINYMKSIFSNNPPLVSKYYFGGYELKLFSDCDKMVQKIKSLESEVGLCRNLAGYSWKWNTKGLTYKQAENLGKYDIEIGNYKYIWNTTQQDWSRSETSINEIGCIHTIQGFDLNYAGVIIGNELKYDPETNKIYIDKDQYFDKNGKIGTSDSELLGYILNIYKVLCSRGILGTYIYACDDNLRKYLEQFISY